jgi:hypothetical protein
VSNWRISGSYLESCNCDACVIPGHDRSGREVVAESLDVHDAGLEFSFRGNCGYESDFDYWG